jgi:amino acid transporter
VTKAPGKELTLFDSTCLTVGIIIGAGIYQMAPDVARGAGSGWGVMALWALGGLISLCGALGYGELATAWPRHGGDFVYLSKAYGPWAGFLFGWIQTVIVRPSDITIMAFAFGMYAETIWDPFGYSGFEFGRQVYACTAVLLMTAINIIGVREGKWTQNLLTTMKVVGLLVIIGAALAAPAQDRVPLDGIDPMPLSVALILVLFTFGGWNEMAYVAAEVRDPKRNIVRALVLGTVVVTVLYLLANAAFLHSLGFGGMAASKAVAVDAVSGVFPAFGARLVSLMICISALGAVNGLIFAGARISFAVGREHRAFRALGRWNLTTGTPVRSLLLQAGVSLTLIIALGSFVNTILYMAASVYAFYLATSIAVFVLRRKEPGAERPYRVAGYPWPTIIFCLVCAFLIYSAVTYRPLIAACSGVLLLAGYPVYRLTNGRR